MFILFLYIHRSTADTTSFALAFANCLRGIFAGLSVCQTGDYSYIRREFYESPNV